MYSEWRHADRSGDVAKLKVKNVLKVAQTWICDVKGWRAGTEGQKFLTAAHAKGRDISMPWC